MRTHKTIDSLYQAQIKSFAIRKMTMKQGHADIAKRSLGDMSELTRGGISSKTLRRLGHPYGRGASAAVRTPTGLMRGADPKKAKSSMGRRTVPLLPINRQSGKLRAGMYLRKTSSPGALQAFALGSDVKYAKYILHPAGTKRMVGRGIFGGKMIGFTKAGAVEKRWRQRNRAFKDYFINKQRTA
jgi:hypothetical protein